jgi:hypothetical protein
MAVCRQHVCAVGYDLDTGVRAIGAFVIVFDSQMILTCGAIDQVIVRSNP